MPVLEARFNFLFLVVGEYFTFCSENVVNLGEHIFIIVR